MAPIGECFPLQLKEKGKCSLKTESLVQQSRQRRAALCSSCKYRNNRDLMENKAKKNALK